MRDSTCGIPSPVIFIVKLSMFKNVNFYKPVSLWVVSWFSVDIHSIQILKNCFPSWGTVNKSQPWPCSLWAFAVSSQYLKKTCMCTMEEKPRFREATCKTFCVVIWNPFLSLLGLKFKQPVFLACAMASQSGAWLAGTLHHLKATCPLSPQLLASGHVERPRKKILCEGFLPSSR